MTYRIPAPDSDQAFTEDLAYLTSLADVMFELFADRLPAPDGPTLYTQLLADERFRYVLDGWPT